MNSFQPWQDLRQARPQVSQGRASRGAHGPTVAFWSPKGPLSGSGGQEPRQVTLVISAWGLGGPEGEWSAEVWGSQGPGVRVWGATQRKPSFLHT